MPDLTDREPLPIGSGTAKLRPLRPSMRRTYVFFRHELFRDVVLGIVEEDAEAELVGASSTISEAIDFLQRQDVACVVMEGDPKTSRDRALMTFLGDYANASACRIIMFGLEGNEVASFERRRNLQLDGAELEALIAGH